LELCYFELHILCNIWCHFSLTLSYYNFYIYNSVVIIKFYFVVVCN
jgi:hypothetical protein